jgi:hypothetical protein
VIEELKNYSGEILRYSQTRFDYTDVYSKKMAAVKSKVQIYEELETWYRQYQGQIKSDQSMCEKKI